MAGGASPAGGTDVRSISTENIESIQIVRGIPSVEYGDLTSGAVIINTKAGREPLRVKAKANPNIYQVSMGTGFELGKKKGALNVSADYAYNTNNPISSYQHYQRATTKLLYSNTSLIISYVPIPALILFMVRINVNVILMMNKLKQLRKAAI